MVDGAGGRSQVASLTTAAIVLVVLLFLTKPLQYMPNAVLASVVFLIGVELVDVKGLRTIFRMRRDEFAIAAITGLLVVVVGVEQAIIVAIVASVIDHLRRSYAPKDAVVLMGPDGRFRSRPVAEGGQMVPGLVVYRFTSGLYFANANRFNEEILALVDGADPAGSVHTVVLEASAVVDVDYSGGLTFKQVVSELHDRGARLMVVQASDEVRAELDRFGITEAIGADAYFPTVGDAVTAHEASGTASAGSSPDPAQG
jgi:SulP family sulfate permease